MKKSTNNEGNRVNHSTVAISATLVESALLKNLVEKIASRRNDSGLRFEKVQAGWKAVETSTIEAYASGDITLLDKTGLETMPFVSCFLFTCCKPAGAEYGLVWANSLS